MDSPGQRLKQVRERLKLRYRDVEEASRAIAGQRGNQEFAIALSRLAEIENKGAVPSLFRLYSLCSIYRLTPSEVMGWYGIPSDCLREARGLPLNATHLVPASEPPTQPDFEDVEGLKTTFLKRLHRWGSLSAAMLHRFDQRHFRYGFIGLADRTMHPILEPGSLVLIDTRRRKVAAAGWTSEYDRPIYFLENRQGHVCGWCSLSGNQLILQHHPGAATPPALFAYPSEIEIVGQVVGAATLIEARDWRAQPDSAARAASPGR